MSILQGATDSRTNSRPGAPGDWAAHSDHDRWASGFNESPAAKQLTSTTVTDPGDGTDITLTIDAGLSEVDITVNTGTGLDAAGIVALFVTAINKEPRIRANVEASANGADLILTGLREGMSFTVTESSGALSTPSTSQAADEADPIPAGRVVIDQGQVGSGPERKVALAKQTLFTPQVITIEVGYIASEVLSAEVWEVRGSERRRIGFASVVSATSQDATLDALATALNASLPSDSVLVASDPGTATQLVFTSEVPGLEFDADVSNLGGGASDPTITKALTTGPSPSTSLAQAFAGIALRPQDEEVADIDDTDPEWPGGHGVRYAQEGQVFVESSQTPTSGGRVYVELAAGDDSGRCYTDAGADRVALPLSLARWVRDSTDSVAVLRLNVP